MGWWDDVCCSSCFDDVFFNVVTVFVHCVVMCFLHRCVTVFGLHCVMMVFVLRCVVIGVCSSACCDDVCVVHRVETVFVVHRVVAVLSSFSDWWCLSCDVSHVLMFVVCHVVCFGLVLVPMFLILLLLPLLVCVL